MIFFYTFKGKCLNKSLQKANTFNSRWLKYSSFPVLSPDGGKFPPQMLPIMERQTVVKFSASNSLPDNNYSSFSISGPKPGNWYIMVATVRNGEQQVLENLSNDPPDVDHYHIFSDGKVLLHRGDGQGRVHHGEEHHHHHPHLPQLPGYQDLLHNQESANLQVEKSLFEKFFANQIFRFFVPSGAWTAQLIVTKCSLRVQDHDQTSGPGVTSCPIHILTSSLGIPPHALRTGEHQQEQFGERYFIAL